MPRLRQILRHVALVLLGTTLLAVTEADAQTARPPVTVEQGIVTVGDTTVEYFSRGSGDAIILLPGSTLTVGYLDGLADSLAAAGYRVIGINLRGTGSSRGPMEGITLRNIADDVAAVVTTLQTGPVHVAGNDYGNRVARMFAAAYPELTRSVILLAAGGKVPPGPDAMQAFLTVMNPEATEEQVLAALPFFIADMNKAQDVWATFSSARDASSGALQEAASKATPLADWWAPPGETSYLILQGAEDQIAPPANGEDLQRQLGDRARLVNVPGAGHLMPIEQPDIAAAEIIAFIEGLGASP